jgi:hypothetical protein
MTKYGTGDRVVLKKRISSYLDSPTDPQPGTRGTVVWADDILEVEFDGYSVYGVRDYMLRKLSPDEIVQEITARAEASSEGDWEASINSDGELIITLEDPEQTAIIWCGDMETCTSKDLNNHKFIAQARKDIMFLLQHIKNQHD